jgi:hypothetical protein
MWFRSDESALLWIENPFPASVGVIPMIAPNLPGPIVLNRWQERYAHRTVDFPFSALSSMANQHNNRRGFGGFSLAGRHRDAHLNLNITTELTKK